MIVNFIEHIL